MRSRIPSSPATRRKNPARKNDRRTSKAAVREYRVVHNGKRWDILRDTQPTGSFADSLHVAIRLAMAEAQDEVHGGVRASVSTVKKDGTWQQVWP
jgi:hypothetical protein